MGKPAATCCLDSDSIPPEKFVRGVKVCLQDDAAEWLETAPGIPELLESPFSQDKVTRFKEEFIAKYPGKVAPISQVSAHSEVTSLTQDTDEDLHQYFRRASHLLTRVGGQDQIKDANPLSIAESYILDNLIDH